MERRRIEFVIAENPPKRLDKAVSRDVPEEATLSRTRLARLIDEGALSVDGQVVRDPKARVEAGAVISVTIEEASDSHIGPEDIPLDVVFEDDDLIVVNKPAGMVVHPAPGTPSGTLVNALMHHCGDNLSGVGGVKRPGIVHRIDKETSGLLVVAKSDVAHQGLAAQFERHTVERYYRAVCYGVPDANDPRLRGVKGASFETGNILKLTTQLARHKTDRQRQAVLFQGGRHAVTRARIVEPFGNPAVAALIECWLETGRTHQIRVHMAHAGHGLIGDPTYGGKRKLPVKALSEKALVAVQAFPRQALHAAVLGFTHPVSGETVRFEAPLPQDMQDLLEALRGAKG
ncbi:RluA family pseudouridine synthase [Phaeobacter gallaeciensis]|jgi:23S rRNA pseudouridine1911/1915/1917 synthase|uniref:RluA family pseudouridine synthase n=1 Tax=Phaeobacter gallaeciensis TaxID=60890 RepID=UPI00237FB93F|nr:RluA family pseudouridine synthase [Phaeobacter gallaeciensis]MDE4305195.1 RluA family pseudouridine synthase [Phaeobacter gallaeciensis]MDE4309543.1 RluA family pseudouridine synthase [Phaeobacter gallaeciensis]MDE4314134.1 RluA family pseudouridine synthase [Phaeobacter gallaeciensis]MDE4318472.1 RluA family pseudouridine synthase [Phaeobacter gallaeciensis]MDE4322768.1 RluA family pseudouridine synthase [Phaeobacter gallaeciensis]